MGEGRSGWPHRPRLKADAPHDLADGARRVDAGEGTTTWTLPRASTVGIARLADDIARGQHVARYRLEGEDDAGSWRTLARGTTIGYAKLDRFAPATVRRVRLTIERAMGTSDRVRLGLFAPAAAE